VYVAVKPSAQSCAAAGTVPIASVTVTMDPAVSAVPLGECVKMSELPEAEAAQEIPVPPPDALLPPAMSGNGALVQEAADPLFGVMTSWRVPVLPVPGSVMVTGTVTVFPVARITSPAGERFVLALTVPTAMAGAVAAT
jgi:hypothetical protein